MIRHDGEDWGTAEEIAQALRRPDVRDVTEGMVRRWADRDGLPRLAMKDAAGRRQVRFPLGPAAEIEARKRLGGRGRPRQLDSAVPTT